MDLFYLLASSNFCDSNAIKRLFSFLGQMFNILKIIIPILIIVMGTIDLLKAIISSDENEIKKAKNIFIKRLILGIVVFFIFPIVSFLMQMIGQNTNNKCMNCFLEPNNKSKCNYNLKNNTENLNGINNSENGFETDDAETITGSANR